MSPSQTHTALRAGSRSPLPLPLSQTQTTPTKTKFSPIKGHISPDTFSPTKNSSTPTRIYPESFAHAYSVRSSSPTSKRVMACSPSAASDTDVYRRGGYEEVKKNLFGARACSPLQSVNALQERELPVLSLLD
eukprot:TRINITY_DN7457_c0_g1_i2.p1 TRINITY_DN7457_c0_g1~~TRINITY_DN7457_c0_g1_i2.p1  ORF type:complete len:133 (-),score=31.70 TRINITY_DN7457_c0_g1_i2:315-713(-)